MCSNFLLQQDCRPQWKLGGISGGWASCCVYKAYRRRKWFHILQCVPQSMEGWNTTIGKPDLKYPGIYLLSYCLFSQLLLQFWVQNNSGAPGLLLVLPPGRRDGNLANPPWIWDLGQMVSAPGAELKAHPAVPVLRAVGFRRKLLATKAYCHL